MEVNVSNYQKKIKISKKWIKKAAIEILRKIGMKGELSIVLADNKYIRRLNRKYRHKDRATDVLSFQQNKLTSSVVSRQLKNNRLSTVLLGDVIVSVERAKSQARTYGHNFKEEMSMLIEHGILHLLGFTHKEMGMKPLKSLETLREL